MVDIRALERQLNQQALSGGTRRVIEPEVIVPAPNRIDIDVEAVRRLEEVRTQATRVNDLLQASLLELLLSQQPRLKFLCDLGDHFDVFRAEYVGSLDEDLSGAWINYADGTLVHHLYPADYHYLRTSRNRGLMPSDEQDTLEGKRIAVSGLSVGAMSAATLAMEGCRQFYLLDTDVLSTSNLNRLHASVADVGLYKTDLAAERIWAIDPFSDVIRDNRGYGGETEDALFSTRWMPDVFIDAMDSPDAKVQAREACRKWSIPLVSLLDIGDGVVQIGCDRYDRDPDFVAFGGRLEPGGGEVSEDFASRILAMVGPDHIPKYMVDSFLQACRGDLPGIPQLAGTVAVAAGIVSHVVRRVLRDEDVPAEFSVNLSNYVGE